MQLGLRGWNGYVEDGGRNLIKIKKKGERLLKKGENSFCFCFQYATRSTGYENEQLLGRLEQKKTFCSFLFYIHFTDVMLDRLASHAEKREMLLGGFTSAKNFFGLGKQILLIVGGGGIVGQYRLRS